MGRNTNLLRKNYKLIVTIFLITVNMAFFQNCSNDVTFTSEELKSKIIPEGMLRINNGEPYTNNMVVQLGIDFQNASWMSLTNGHCPELGSLAASDWNDAGDHMDWQLNDQDGNSKVSLILKSSDGNISGCISADIILDRVSPVIIIDKAPFKETRNSKAEFELVASDATSGIRDMYCRKPGDTEFEKCSKDLILESLEDGTKSIVTYVEDKAGNKSDFVEYTWVVDQTPPVVELTAPSAGTMFNINTVVAEFSGSDLGGTGVVKYNCKLNNTVMDNCQSPLILKDLADGNYVLSVVALDKVGNLSLVDDVNFSVDTKPSGDFLVLGLTGGADVKMDQYLSVDAVPRVHWTASQGAQSYVASILDINKQPVCGPVAADAQAVFADFAANCRLMDNQKFYARVVATRNNLETAAPDFMFTSDFSAPIIDIVRISKMDEEKKATIEFSVIDAGVGVKAVTCYRKFKNDLRADDCKDKTSITYSNLVSGDYEFYITASDNLDHFADSEIEKFNIQFIVCDPFKMSEEKCRKGLRSNLYYASADDLKAGETSLRNKYNKVGSLIENGVKSNALIFLPFLDVRTRVFTEGFSTSEKTTLKDDNGNTLIEWFALDLFTLLKLGPNDSEGLYQLIIVSDDGSIVSTLPEGSSSMSVIIDNDGLHSTKVGCMAKDKVLDMKRETRLPTSIQYYQGPKTQIGLSVFWRKVSKATSARSSYCGQSGSDGYGFGKAEHYKLLEDEGFRPLSPDNFILPEEDVPTPQ